MKKRLAVLAVTTALAFGSTIGIASATNGGGPPEPQPREHCDNGVGNGSDNCRPGNARFNNDDELPPPGFGVPGNPGSKGGYVGGNAY